MEIGDAVCKKSRKPFQNGKRVGIIEEWDVIPTPKGMIEAAVISGCRGAVCLRNLTNNTDSVLLMKERDNNQN